MIVAELVPDRQQQAGCEIKRLLMERCSGLVGFSNPRLGKVAARCVLPAGFLEGSKNDEHALPISAKDYPCPPHAKKSARLFTITKPPIPPSATFLVS
jgi:hypothetical protein